MIRVLWDERLIKQFDRRIILLLLSLQDYYKGKLATRWQHTTWFVRRLENALAR